MLLQNTQCDSAIAQYVANQEQRKFHLSAGYTPAGYSSSLGATSYPSTAYATSGYTYAQKFQ